jgi:hypothetical protein
MVARACHILTETQPFLPAPADFAAALKKARWPGIAAKDVHRALLMTEQAETAVAEAARLGPLSGVTASCPAERI